MSKENEVFTDDLVKRWDDYVESMGCVMGEVEHMAQQMRDRIEELEAKLASAEDIIHIVASDKWDERLGEAVDLSCEYLAMLKGQDDG